jgi:shikimate kinase
MFSSASALAPFSHLALCGMMGSGKSAIGRAAGQKLNMSFVDVDALIEQRAGMSIASIFETEGEQAFRQHERETLRKLSDSESRVIGLGGGSLQNQQVVEWIKKNMLLCFIDTPLDVISERVQRNTKRPLLLDEKGRMKPEYEVMKILKALYESRLPLYSQAHIRYVPQPGNSINTSASELLDLLQNR